VIYAPQSEMQRRTAPDTFIVAGGERLLDITAG
jgi:hypothetical protein